MFHVLELCNIYTIGTLENRVEMTDQIRKTALCAAFIHDQARQHDELCFLHGTWAVKEKLPLYVEKFKKYGLTDEDIEALKTAVTYHSLPNELEKDHPHYLITAILKDADALDRIRLTLRGSKGLDPRYLRLSHSKDFIEDAEELFFETNNDDIDFEYPTWEEFLATAKEISRNPLNTLNT
jgi:hypothetical protein